MPTFHCNQLISDIFSDFKDDAYLEKTGLYNALNISMVEAKKCLQCKPKKNAI